MTAERRQGLLYLMVGAWNTAFGFGSFVVLQMVLGNSLGYLAILVVAWVVNVVEAFVAYRVVVFRVRGNFLRDFGRFASVYVGAFAFNLAALPLAVDVAGVPVLVAQAVVVVITVVSSFFLHRGFSFKRDAPVVHGDAA